MKIIALALFFISCSDLLAQEKPLEKSLSYFKDGVVLEHEPTNFKMKFRFRMQNRFTYETKSGENLSPEIADFAVRRMRLRMEGNVLDPRLLYKVQLSFTRGDFDYDRTQYPNVLRDAAVGWKLSDRTTFWYGQTKLPGNRQRVISSGDQQLVDRSLVNATFNIDRDLGAQMYHQFGDEQPFWLKLAISNGEGRATENKSNGMAYTSRIEWLPLGNFTDGGDYFEADLAREQKPKLSFGAVYSLNKKTTRPGGQLGQEFKTKGLNRDLETWLADALFKYRGFSWSSEYAKRWTDDAVFTDTDPAKPVTIFKGQGFNTQAGYVFENNMEPVVRYTKIWADRDTLLGTNDQAQYTLGLGKYINKHKVKVLTDLTFVEESNRRSKLYENNWVYRLQLEIGI
jgi:phosphate-selective porin OprO/OprP